MLNRSTRIWEHFPIVFAAIRQSHELVGLSGHHDIHHAARVGQMAFQIALEEWRDEETAHQAGLAGLCHNADRIMEIGRYGEFRGEEMPLDDLVNRWLDQDRIHADARAAVLKAVKGHANINQVDDSCVQIALMDADRVVNLSLDAVMRSAQHHKSLQTVDYQHALSNPNAQYSSPQSVLKGLWFHTEWADPTTNVCVRTHYGKREAQKRLTLIQQYMENVLSQITDEGFFPLPY